jgi:isopenicillin N synthase-like dioxygenase
LPEVVVAPQALTYNGAQCRGCVWASDNLMVSKIELPHLPVIDLSLFDLGDPWRDPVAAQVDSASSRFGFFYLVGHGIDTTILDPLMEASRRFSAIEKAVQGRVALDREPAASATSVLGQILLREVPGFREPVIDYTRSLTGLAHKLMSMIARGLLLEGSYFVDRYTGNPSTSFRIFNHPQAAVEIWSSTAVTDQGLLTIMWQDCMGGLELKYQGSWVEAHDIPNSLICTVGETLAQLTNRRYVAAAYRVRNSAHGHRVSMPFCFDVSQDVVIKPIVTVRPGSPRGQLSGDTSNSLPQVARRPLA